MAKIDKRIIKTTNAIKEAFMYLAMKKEVNKITITDIADKALINRATFYLHYTDVNSVMLDIEKDITEYLTSDIEKFYPSLAKLDPYPLLYSLAAKEDLLENTKKYVLTSTGSALLTSKLKNIFCDIITKAFEENSSLPKTQLSYVIKFVSSGCIDAFQEWYQNQNISLEEVCNILSKTIANGVYGIRHNSIY